MPLAVALTCLVIGQRDCHKRHVMLTGCIPLDLCRWSDVFRAISYIYRQPEMSCTSRVISRAATSLASSSRLVVLASIPNRSPIAGPSRIPYQPRFAIRNATSFASSSSAAENPGLPPIPTQPVIRVQPPSLDAIKEEGYMEDDVTLVPPEEAKLVITQSAVQVSVPRLALWSLGYKYTRH